MLQTGETLAGYRIDGIAGVGGMGVVYRATQLSLDRPVALKVLSGSLVGNRTFRERFRREGRHAAALDHPNIIPVYEAGEANGLMFIAMRLVDGPSLADLVAGNAVSGREALRIVGAIASALDAAHEAGLVHRDIKPQNILLTKTGHVYLADFGITKGTANAGLTHSADFVGSLNYVAPEQIEGTVQVTRAADIYALAAVLFQCLSGLYPYERDSDAALMHAHLMAPPPTLLERGVTTAPPALDEVFRTAMSKVPAERHATATALVEACERALATVGGDVLDLAPAFAPEGMMQTIPSPVKRTTEPDELAWSAAPAAVLPPALAVPEAQRFVPEPAGMTAADVRRPGPAIEQAPVAGFPRRSLVLGLAAGLVLVGAPLAGYALGHVDPPPKSEQAASPALTLEHDASWSPSRGSIRGLRLQQLVALRRSDGLKLVAGRLARFDSGFDPVPAALRARFQGKSADATIRLGAATATRHAVSLGGTRRLWLALAPDTKGWVAIACEGPGADAASACPSVAASLKIKGATAIALGPDAELAGSIGTVLSDLNRARRNTAVPLRSKSLDVRAHAVNRSAFAHTRAAGRLTRLPLRPQERPLVTAVADALRAQAPNLARLANATVKRRRATYNAARTAIRRQEQRIAAALRRLRSIGYDAR